MDASEALDAATSACRRATDGVLQGYVLAPLIFANGACAAHRLGVRLRCLGSTSGVRTVEAAASPRRPRHREKDGGLQGGVLAPLLFVNGVAMEGVLAGLPPGPETRLPGGPMLSEDGSSYAHVSDEGSNSSSCVHVCDEGTCLLHGEYSR